jgi:hypothetical protein
MTRDALKATLLDAGYDVPQEVVDAWDATQAWRVEKWLSRGADPAQSDKQNPVPPFLAGYEV